MKKQQGFTLIELLIVIAIIGLLSSLAVVSLSGARNKAYDAQIKSDLAQVRTSLEMSASDNGGSYAAWTMPANINAPACSGTKYVASTTAIGFRVYGQLCANTAQYFCIDGNGNVTTTSAVPTAGAETCL
ncbi:MAG: type II secretion system protein [bacterium]